MPQYNYCIQIPFDQPMQMKDLSLERLNDATISAYKGLVSTPWDSSSFHQFDVVMDPANPSEIGNIYFEPVSLGYRY